LTAILAFYTFLTDVLNFNGDYKPDCTFKKIYKTIIKSPVFAWRTQHYNNSMLQGSYIAECFLW